METVAYILLIIILFLGVKFVNKTKKDHHTCCGRGCRGCEVFAKERERKNNSK